MDLDFWNRVVFFNFLPDCVGDENEKFKDGTPDQIKLGKLRVLRITRELKPHKMIVFTYKGWEAFPSTDEETTGLGGTTPLGESYPPKFRWGTYCFDGQTTTAFGLRHPQGANGELMRRAVSTIMETPKRD